MKKIIWLILMCICFSSLGQSVYHYNKIVVVIGENSDAGTVFGNLTDAPYINALANIGAKLTNSFGIGHPSQPNYLYLYSGANQGVTDDAVPAGIPFTTANLGKNLINAGKTYITYSQGLPSVGYNGASSGNYARKHNPAANWMGAGTNQIPTTTNQPFTAFPSDYSMLPDVSFVVPDQCDDGHNTCAPLNNQVKQYDTWVATNLDAYKQWCVNNNSLLIVTYDEDDNAGGGNKIATLFYGANVPVAVHSATYNHFNILRTIEDAMGLSTHAGAAATALPVYINNYETPHLMMHQTEMIKSGGEVSGSMWWFDTNLASIEANPNFSYTGTYRLDISAIRQAGTSVLNVLIDGVSKGTISVSSTTIAIHSLLMSAISAGTHNIKIQITNFSSGINHCKVGMVYLTQTTEPSPLVFPTITPIDLPTGGQFITKEHFASKKLRGFSLGSNGTNQPSEPVTSMTAMKATGANIARCFVEIERFSGDTYTFKSGEITKLDTTIARGARLGFYVVPVIFHDPSLNSDYWGTTASQIARRTSITALWTTLANRYKSSSTVAAFDLINEPRSNNNYAEVIRWQTDMVNTIRAIDTSHVIIVECIKNEMFASMLPLGFSNIVYSPHGYSPLNITHQGVVGEPGANVRNKYPTLVATANQPIFGKSDLSKQHDDVRIMTNRFHVPIFIGEFSCVHWAPVNDSSSVNPFYSKWSATMWSYDNISLLEAENWSWVYHNWARGGEAIEWDCEIPGQWYIDNAISFSNATPATKAPTAARSDTAPTIVMLKEWFGLNSTTVTQTQASGKIKHNNIIIK